MIGLTLEQAIEAIRKGAEIIPLTKEEDCQELFRLGMIKYYTESYKCYNCFVKKNLSESEIRKIWK